MVIKKLIFCLEILLLSSHIQAQDLASCMQIVDKTVESLNNKSTDQIENHLAEDFTIANQTGQIAVMVIKQLISQLGDPIVSYKEVNLQSNEDELILDYEFIYESKGPQETRFVFNKNNQVKELSLFKMQVKKMDANNSKIEKSHAKQIAIPFQLMEKLIAVDVEVNGELRKFLLDTGAPKVILNSKYFEEAKDTISKKIISSTKGVNGSVTGMNLIHIDSLDFNGIRLMDQEVLTLDLSNLEDHGGLEIYGLIGYELIKDFDLVFDYSNMLLTLVAPEVFENYELEVLKNSPSVVIPTKQNTHLPIIETLVNGEAYRFGLDSGAETNLLDDDLYLKLAEHLSETSIDTLSGVGGNHQEVPIGFIRNTEIGNKSFQDMETVFSDISHINDGYQIKIDGIIGYELLSRQVSVLSYSRKELRLY